MLAQLRGEFPDVSVSKIRFLESEGLIQPARSPSNYRRFGPADVDRLRYILTAQRDEYLPLRVIKDRLAAADGDAGTDPDGPARRAARRAAEPGGNCSTRPGSTTATWPNWKISAWSGRPAGSTARTRWTRRGSSSRWAGTACRPGTCAAVRAAVERETALIEQVVAPTLRQRSPGSRDRAGQTAREIAALSLQLHAIADGRRAGRGRTPRDRAGRGRFPADRRIPPASGPDGPPASPSTDPPPGPARGHGA